MSSPGKGSKFSKPTYITVRMQRGSFLSNSFPYSRINFDLHDCDKILRIEGVDFTIEKVQVLVAQKGFECCVLD
jgi:hypothetical protein